MLSTPAAIARYWTCGGEIFALGGPLPLVVSAGRTSPGCRLLSRGQLARLAAWHRHEAAGPDQAITDYHRLCLRDVEPLLARAHARAF